jgi:hypothetical protein
MSETLTIEERLRRFAASPDDADWQDVLRRADMSRRRRPRWTRRRLVAAVVVMVALAVATVAVADRSLFGVSNHGKRAHAGRVALDGLEGGVFHRLGIRFGSTAAANPRSFVRLAFRDGIGVYAARSKKGNRRCYYTRLHVVSAPGQPSVDPAHRLQFNGGCGRNFGGLGIQPFPSAVRPVLDMSGSVAMQSRRRNHPKRLLWEQFVAPVVGLAADGVRSMQLLALSDCHPVVTVPVIDNVYINAHPPAVAEGWLVARNAGGKIVWHEPLYVGDPVRLPLDRSVPRNCGLG